MSARRVKRVRDTRVNKPWIEVSGKRVFVISKISNHADTWLSTSYYNESMANIMACHWGRVLGLKVKRG